ADGIVVGANTIVVVTASVSHVEFSDPLSRDRVDFTVNAPVTQAYVAIDPGGNINNSSTFSGGIQVINQSTSGAKITSVEFDLNGAIYFGNVFDPMGTAGDAQFKCVTMTSNRPVGMTIPGDGGTGSDPDCTTPFSDPLGNGGSSVMTLDFTEFDFEDTIDIAVDIDPISTEGLSSSPVTGAGAVSGLELIGSKVTVTFSDGNVYEGELYRMQPNSQKGAANTLKTETPCAAPTLDIQGAVENSNLNGFLDATVFSPNQVAVISGIQGESVSLLVIESNLQDVGPGVITEEYDANKAQSVAEFDGIIPADGTLELPFTMADNASGDIYHIVAVKTKPDGTTCNTSIVWRVKVEEAPFGIPKALFTVTPSSTINATSTGGADKFQITNQSTGNLKITKLTLDLGTAILPDMVFDPEGDGGGQTGECLTPASSATLVGMIVPGDPCADPFSRPYQGGFEVISMDFDDFNPGESFSFSVDIDPNSIQGVSAPGVSENVAGVELIGATVTIEFTDGSTSITNLYEDGSDGGAQTVTPFILNSPTITFQGVDNSPAAVGEVTQTAVLTGNPNAYYSLLQLDARLYIDSGEPPFNVNDPDYYGNQALAKTLYSGQFDGTGQAIIPISLMQTAMQTQLGGDGGINYFMAVQSSQPYAPNTPISLTSDVHILRLDPNLPVEWLGFRATRRDPHVQLDWTTATETDNDRFEIERSLDGEAFYSIGQVVGAGQSNLPLDYAFLDRNAVEIAAENLFYRLRQVDFDGTTNYSDIVAVPLNNNDPSANYQLQTLDLGRHYRLVERTGRGINSLKIVSLYGQVIEELNFDNLSSIDIPTNRLPAGTYLLIANDEYRQKLLIVR
ncbi:MAG: hypothetical protein AAFU03_06620, partial [Bacteroidota bacterium]